MKKKRERKTNETDWRGCAQVEFGNNNPLVMFLDFPRRMSMVCSACHGDPVMQELANATVGTYDVVLVEAILNECMMPLVHHLGAPFIYLNSIMPAPWHVSETTSQSGPVTPEPLPISLSYWPMGDNDDLSSQWRCGTVGPCRSGRPEI